MTLSGVFAVAFAIFLTFEVNPAQITFDIHRMKPHLASCLKSGALNFLIKFFFHLKHLRLIAAYSECKQILESGNIFKPLLKGGWDFSATM